MKYKCLHITYSDILSRMPKIIEMKRRVFGNLTVLSRVAATGQARWLCACRCGKQTIQPGYELRIGAVISCGCVRKTLIGKLTSTHGMTGTREYRAWVNMRNRCFRPSNNAYDRYGALGITVCDEWRHSFESFFADLGYCPDNHSLDRIDPAGNYCGENCRWANIEVQSNNKTRVKSATINGETKPIVVWCRELNINHRTVRARIYEHKWAPEKALLTPIRIKTKN
jgi:hypothetical protein